MKIRPLGLVIFGLAIVALITYALSKGLYVSSAIDVSTREGEGKFLYSKSCRYLSFDGLHEITRGSESPSREGVEATSCALMENSN